MELCQLTWPPQAVDTYYLPIITIWRSQMTTTFNVLIYQSFLISYIYMYFCYFLIWKSFLQLPKRLGKICIFWEKHVLVVSESRIFPSVPSLPCSMPLQVQKVKCPSKAKPGLQKYARLLLYLVSSRIFTIIIKLLVIINYLGSYFLLVFWFMIILWLSKSSFVFSYRKCK